jgi:hypothetical protein
VTLRWGYHAFMMKSITAVLVMVGCERSPAGTVDLSTPSAAARCQVESVRARNVELWTRCFHPTLVDEARSEMARRTAKSGFWETAASRTRPLESAADHAFKREPTKDAQLGDETALLRLGEDDFAVVRKNGRWYIVDTGL